MSLIHILKEKKGTSLVLFSIALAILAGFASIAVDIGMVVSEKAHLAAAADAAALAGAQELEKTGGDAVGAVNIYLLKNGIAPQNATITVSDDEKSISVIIKKNINYFFAKILGYGKANISSSAAADIEPVTEVSAGIRPFAIENQQLEYGKVYVLKEGAGGASNGNYGLLALGGTGASNVEHNILDGYNSALKVEDYVETETGNKSGVVSNAVNHLLRQCRHYPKCVFDSYQPDCSRIITVIIAASLDVNGRKLVQIAGFASFFLEDVVDDGGHTQITGRFIKTTANGNTDKKQTDYGLRGIRLVN